MFLQCYVYYWYGLILHIPELLGQTYEDRLVTEKVLSRFERCISLYLSSMRVDPHGVNHSFEQLRRLAHRGDDEEKFDSELEEERKVVDFMADLQRRAYNVKTIIDYSKEYEDRTDNPLALEMESRHWSDYSWGRVPIIRAYRFTPEGNSVLGESYVVADPMTASHVKHYKTPLVAAFTDVERSIYTHMMDWALYQTKSKERTKFVPPKALPSARTAIDKVMIDSADGSIPIENVYEEILKACRVNASKVLLGDAYLERHFG